MDSISRWKQMIPARMVGRLGWALLVAPLLLLGSPEAQAQADLVQVKADLKALVNGQGPPIGRSPGSPGHQYAATYLRMQFRELGLTPAFSDDEGNPSFDQALPTTNTRAVAHAMLRYTPPEGEPIEIDFGDITPHWSSGSGKVEADGLFAGYAVVTGPQGYMSFVQRNDLSERVVLALRLEPMTESGRSRWAQAERSASGWTPRASSIQKASALMRRNAQAVVLLTPPGVDNPEAAEIAPPRNAREIAFERPVVTLSAEASERLIALADPESRTLHDLRLLADSEPVLFELPGRFRLELEMTEGETVRTNIAGLLPGKGDLAHELIVLTAHYDGPHSMPAADTNASGVAGLLHCARVLRLAYKQQLDEVEHARSILLLASDDGAIEPLGVRHYFDNPITDLKHHAMLMVIDGIGRPERETVQLQGENRGEGLAEWMDPHLERSFFEFNRFPEMGYISLFSRMIGPDRPAALRWSTRWSEDHETELDTVDALDVDSIVAIADQIAEIVLEMAFDPTRFALVGSSQADRSRPPVRLGLRPIFTTSNDGVQVASVMDELPAMQAGIRAGDLLIEWNGQPMPNFDAMGEFIGETSRGDSVEITLIRDGETMTVKVQFPE